MASSRTLLASLAVSRVRMNCHAVLCQTVPLDGWMVARVSVIGLFYSMVSHTPVPRRPEFHNFKPGPSPSPPSPTYLHLLRCQQPRLRVGRALNQRQQVVHLFLGG